MTVRVTLLVFCVVAASCSLTGAASARQGMRIMLDKAKLRQLTHDVGIASLLEKEGHNMAMGARAEDAQRAAITELPSAGATAMEVQSGDFEIKCATSCDFVKRGAAEFMDSPFGAQSGSASKGAMAAAQALEELYLKMARLQDQLAADPTNPSLVKQRQQLQAKINAQTALLNAVAGGGALEAPVSNNDAQRLEQLQAKLQQVMIELTKNPDDTPLIALRKQLKEEIADRQKAVEAQKALVAKRQRVESEVATLQARLDQLKAQAGSMPNDANLAKEIAKVEAMLADAQKSESVMNPQEDCSRVCTKPSVGSAASSENCVRTCVKVVRLMAYKMAKTFL